MEYLLSLFKSLKTVIIYTTSNTGFATYNFNYSLFLKHCLCCNEFLEHESIKEVQVRATIYDDYDEESWISKLCPYLKNQMDDEKFKIYLSNDPSVYPYGV